ncbi:hypothetical protein FRB96_002352 [Tulasnella sp. 330]|nr:hypothetical protein FRB96_002352 [Tulasnella sp. 330]KAG8879203.1 hypothetical protein FRB97_001870 [Tulasnella sp. 331]KAG8885223.1 hypothetical protein FRB98_001905 [Tulasnella sp. 332]
MHGSTQVVIIIGAGPSGLVTCKTLLDANERFGSKFDPVILEQEDDLGGTFRYRSYENANLVSSKQLTSFTDYRLPLEHHDHLTLEEISRGKGGKGHIVEYVKGVKTEYGDVKWNELPMTMHAAYLAVCSGLHVTPSVPVISGIEHVGASMRTDGLNDPKTIKPVIMHSSSYKTPACLSGRRVMILGTGETGMDLAYESVKGGAKEVVLCTRNGFLSFPKVLNNFTLLGYNFKGNLPIDGLITNLFETAYVHPWVARTHLRWFISDFVVKRVLWLLTGTMAGCNQWVGELPESRLGRAYVFLNKSNKAMPYINRPYRNRAPILDWLSQYEEPAEDMPPNTDFAVELAPFPEKFTAEGRAVFPLTERKESIRMAKMDVRPDMLLFATGYKQDFSFFAEGEGYPTTEQLDVRDLFKSGDESVAFIGFLRPGVGAIPPISEMQAQLWAAILTSQVPVPTSQPHYHLLQGPGSRITYGVDHSAIIATLAKDLGAAPALLRTLWDYGPHVLICYAFGAAMTPFYRLYGPFRDPGAELTVKTEIWETITRRGFLGNLFMGVIPMMFYAIINIIAFGIETVYCIVTGQPRAT